MSSPNCENPGAGGTARGVKTFPQDNANLFKARCAKNSNIARTLNDFGCCRFDAALVKWRAAT
jgi:hypothetical protein